MNKRMILAGIVSLLTTTTLSAQTKKADTVIIRVGQASKVIFAIQDKKDLETLKKYDFQALMDDMIRKLENNDSSQISKPAPDYLKEQPTEETPAPVTPEPAATETTTENWSSNNHYSERRYRRSTYHSFNFDIGTNNFLQNGKFPDQSNAAYSVRPWGSWYIGINSVQRTRLAGILFVEWGFGVSWYNFKFQDNSVVLNKTSDNVTFVQDSRGYDYLKSKLTASYLNASVVPMIDFGKGGRKTSIFDGSRVDFSSRGNHSSSFRIGVGPYAGYRIDSYTKLIYSDAGKKNTDRHHDPYYLNNIRYGWRLQFGFNDVDFFFNYDMNEVFLANRGPKLHAFAFGVTF